MTTDPLLQQVHATRHHADLMRPSPPPPVRTLLLALTAALLLAGMLGGAAAADGASPGPTLIGQAGARPFPRPDLTVASRIQLYMDGPQGLLGPVDTGCPYRTCYLGFYVRNQGTGAAGEFAVTYQSASDPLIPREAFAGLAPGASVWVLLSVPRCALVGTVRIVLQGGAADADPSNDTMAVALPAAPTC